MKLLDKMLENAIFTALVTAPLALFAYFVGSALIGYVKLALTTIGGL